MVNTKKYKPVKATRWHPTTIVWVKNAKMWCKSSWQDGKQIIVWSKNKEELEEQTETVNC